MGSHAWEVIAFGAPNPRLLPTRLQATPVDESLKFSPIVGAGTIGLMVWGFYGDSFTSTYASEDSSSLMGGSTVVMCVPLG